MMYSIWIESGGFFILFCNLSKNFGGSTEKYMIIRVTFKNISAHKYAFSIPIVNNEW